jgi:hypothetical protein
MNRCSTVGSSGAEAPVLVHLCLDSNEASDRPMVSTLRPSDHLVPCLRFFFSATRLTLLKKWTIGSSDGVFSFLSCSVLTLEKYTIFSNWHVVFWHPWDLEISTNTC